MYLFYNFCTTLHVSNDHFVHHQEFMIYCICSSVQTMQTWLTALAVRPKQLDTFAWFSPNIRDFKYGKCFMSRICLISLKYSV